MLANDVVKEYPAKAFIQNKLAGHQKTNFTMMSYGMPMNEIENQVPRGCREEFKDYFESGVLLPPAFAVHPTLQRILTLPASKSRSKKLREHIETTWKPNVTLVDLPFLRQGTGLLDVAHNPAELATHLYQGCIWEEPKAPKKLFDYARLFFWRAAMALTKVRDRLVVEALSGDITRVPDSIQNGLLEDRNPVYPIKYDRIHLSNIT
jgi:hypothetical protein